MKVEPLKNVYDVYELEKLGGTVDQFLMTYW